MRTGILHIGDELLTGEIDPYPREMIEMIRRKGARLNLLEVLADREDDIIKGFEHARELGVNILVVTGGLGPTLDDITREALARYLGVELVVDAGAEKALAEGLTLMHCRPIMMNDALRRMARVPTGAKPLKNITGQACGVEAVKGEMTIFLLPGFPDEMVPMFREHILPRIEGNGEIDLDVKVSRGESLLEPLFELIVAEFPVQLASLPSKTDGTRVIIKGRRKDAEAAMARFQSMVAEMDEASCR
ncbi:MAG: molybdopterin-binding protein [Methanomassiliicoccus sp.]|nr:molybdopterin-binding protein [Methanomassiliicoccus sp.]